MNLRGKKTYDFGTIELDRANSVIGRVLDSTTGEPIEGATVLKIYSESEPSYIIRWNFRNVKTTTNADGEFELDGFPSKNGRIRTWARGYEGESRTIDDTSILLEFELKPTGTIVGEVVSQNNEPIGAMIHFLGGAIRTEDGNFQLRFREGTHSLQSSAESGRSDVVEVVVTGGETTDTIRLVIDVIGRVHGMIEGLVKDETAKVWVAGRERLLLNNGTYNIIGVPTGEHVVRAQTTYGRELEGAISMNESSEARYDFKFIGNASLAGRVLAGAEGLEGIEVLAQPKNPILPTGRTETSTNGAYQFDVLANGVYEIRVPSRAFSEEVEVQGITSHDVSVGNNRLAGKLRAASSVLNAKVYVTGGPPGQNLNNGIIDTVDSSGNFSFIGLPSGTYTLRISHPDYVEKSKVIDLEFDVTDLDLYLEESSQ